MKKLKTGFTLAEGATHVGTWKDKCRAAFTLAEVLITLAIIGVVAAVTLPVLIHKFQMKTYETAFKKEYAQFSNALEYISIEDSINNCYMSYTGKTSYVYSYKECSQLRTSLIKYLSLKVLSKNISYKNKSSVIDSGGVLVNQYANFYDTELTWYRSRNGGLYCLNNLPYIILDVNGTSKPNKWGYDVFLMHLTPIKSAKRIILTDNLQGAKEKGGVLMRQILDPKDKSTTFKYDNGGF